MSPASIIGKASKDTVRGVAQQIGKRAHTATSLAKGVDHAIFKRVGIDERVFGRQMRTSAFGVFMGGAAIMGVAEGAKQVDQSRVGSKSGGVVRATPTIPTYMEEGGATGDLVFALHDLRRG